MVLHVTISTLPSECVILILMIVILLFSCTKTLLTLVNVIHFFFFSHFSPAIHPAWWQSVVFVSKHNSWKPTIRLGWGGLSRPPGSNGTSSCCLILPHHILNVFIGLYIIICHLHNIKLKVLMTLDQLSVIQVITYQFNFVQVVQFLYYYSLTLWLRWNRFVYPCLFLHACILLTYKIMRNYYELFDYEEQITVVNEVYNWRLQLSVGSRMMEVEILCRPA